MELSKKTQLLLESFRLLEQSRAKYFEYLDELWGDNEKEFDIAAALVDPAWTAIRDKILKEDISETLYLWANAQDCAAL